MDYRKKVTMDASGFIFLFEASLLINSDRQDPSPDPEAGFFFFGQNVV